MNSGDSNLMKIFTSETPKIMDVFTTYKERHSLDIKYTSSLFVKYIVCASIVAIHGSKSGNNFNIDDYKILFNIISFYIDNIKYDYMPSEINFMVLVSKSSRKNAAKSLLSLYNQIYCFMPKTIVFRSRTDPCM